MVARGNKCRDCAKFFKDIFDLCIRAEMEEVFDDSDACEKFVQHNEIDERDYTPSATYGDYSPTHKWDAPGMRVKDFIR